jgi:hypothetical protein
MKKPKIPTKKELLPSPSKVEQQEPKAPEPKKDVNINFHKYSQITKLNVEKKERSKGEKLPSPSGVKQ